MREQPRRFPAGTRCQSCGEMIPFPVREREDEETWIKCRQCETWSDFKKQPKAMYLTPRQRAKLD